MKLGMDFETNQKSILTSWISGQIPSFGGFPIEWSPNANGTGQLVMRHCGNIYWVSRIGNDILIFRILVRWPAAITSSIM
jgi:hypothetical protein